MIIAILVYLLLLMGVARLSSRKGSNAMFFSGERRSRWWMVAFGMVGASISGITFVSVPGMVVGSGMTYLQLCIGFIFGYLAVAFVLLPLYYRLQLTSIYAYLGQRFGRTSHLSGSWLFLVSKLAGAALKFYVVCMVLQRFVFAQMGVPFLATVVMLIAFIWLYTRRGGIGTLVVTDTFQTLCLLTALLAIAIIVMSQLHLSLSEAVSSIAADDRSRIFVVDDLRSPQNLWKQLLSGAFIVIVMTGLDQDMMQKNLTCRNLRDAQKDMCTYGMAFVPVNLLFLALGVLLTHWYEANGMALPKLSDEMLPAAVEQMGAVVAIPFVIGIVAASMSSADSALTSLTTIFCVDICHSSDNERLRKTTHITMCLLFAASILLFHYMSKTSLIDAIYTLVGYTYGPLLGMFAFGLLTKRRPRDRWVPLPCLLSPILCYLLSIAAQQLWGYRFGYELLLLNGMLTFAGLWLISIRPAKTKQQLSGE